MKKTIFAVMIMFIMAGLHCSKKEERIEREGIINFMAGRVRIIEGSEDRAARVGDIVRKGITIKTGFQAFVDIYFDQNAVRILENSVVDIRTLDISARDGSEHSAFYVEEGRVFARVLKKLSKNDSFSVSTITTTAAVRGTEFLVASEELKSLVACLNGQVVVSNDAAPDLKPVRITNEQQVVVEKDRPMTVEDLSVENRNRIDGIRKTFKEMRKDIRARFEKKRDEIRRSVNDRREKNREMLKKRRERDLENVEEQRAKDRENVDRLRAVSEKSAGDASEGVGRQRNNSRKALDRVRPKIKKALGKE